MQQPNFEKEIVPETMRNWLFPLVATLLATLAQQMSNLGSSHQSFVPE